jgi:hypothetical protein
VERLKSESVEAPGRSNEFVSIRTQLQEARKELELAKLENGDLKGVNMRILNQKYRCLLALCAF